VRSFNLKISKSSSRIHACEELVSRNDLKAQKCDCKQAKAGAEISVFSGNSLGGNEAEILTKLKPQDLA
jgi:hypothetical protein